MAIKYIRNQRKKSDGTYDTIHAETSASVVWTKEGISVEEALENSIGASSLLRGPLTIEKSCTFDLSTLGLKIGDPINVICVGGGGGGGGGATGGSNISGTPSGGTGGSGGKDGGNSNSTVKNGVGGKSGVGYGAGGGGGGSHTSASYKAASGGGGGSGYVDMKTVIIDNLKVPITIGVGGAGGAGGIKGAAGAAGGSGGTTSFGSYLYALGGGGGGGATDSTSKDSTAGSGGVGLKNGSSGSAGDYVAGGKGAAGVLPDTSCLGVKDPAYINYGSDGCVIIWY